MGGENIAANSLLFKALSCGSALANVMKNPTQGASWSSLAVSVQKAANSILWDDVKGAFKDNQNSVMYPQDGNSLAVWYGLVQPANRSARVSEYLSGNWGPYGSATPEWNRDVGTFPGSLEVLAHMAAGQTTRALALIRLQWGYMLNNPNSTQSTFWEGYHHDGTFAYQGTYMSNAHGWATGPVSALSGYVVGMAQTSVVGRAWAVIPQTGDLTSAQGSLRLDGKEGYLRVAWVNGTSTFSLNVDASGLQYDATAIGVIGVPVGDPNVAVVTVNGATAWSGGVFQGAIPGIPLADTDGSYVFFRNVLPMAYTLLVKKQN